MHILYTPRIGHLAINTEIFLRRKSIGLVDGELFRLIDHPTGKFISNNQLYKMIKRSISVKEITTEEYLKLVKAGHQDNGLLPCNSNETWELNNIPPQLSFLPYEIKKGQDLLKKMGINDKPFVCMHSRDNLYLKELFNDFDYSYHNYRDCSISNYLDAAEWLTTQGFYVLRMGQITAEKLQTDNPMIIDYANLYRTDFGDAFLPANCDFFLGNTAGIFLVSTIFNINSAVANYAPLDITPFLRNDIYLPKYLNMPLSQQLEISIEIMEKNPPPLVENSSLQILKLVKEMVYRKKGVFNYDLNLEQLNNKFRSMIKPKNRCYGSCAIISSDFLKDNSSLMH